MVDKKQMNASGMASRVRQEVDPPISNLLPYVPVFFVKVIK